mmetsp:Transcript_51542/g.95377  ORF Transcript_51542/g.95377 Transcript_51542/m.95377 type:complete len:229 (-) Transcript_51542:541-1227(-)
MTHLTDLILHVPQFQSGELQIVLVLHRSHQPQHLHDRLFQCSSGRVGVQKRSASLTIKEDGCYSSAHVPIDAIAEQIPSGGCVHTGSERLGHRLYVSWHWVGAHQPLDHAHCHEGSSGGLVEVMLQDCLGLKLGIANGCLGGDQRHECRCVTEGKARGRIHNMNSFNSVLEVQCATRAGILDAKNGVLVVRTIDRVGRDSSDGLRFRSVSLLGEVVRNGIKGTHTKLG